jgi:hypothetical protein
MKGIEGAFQDLTVFLVDLAVITRSYEQRNNALFAILQSLLYILYTLP